jgi:hypothetical protein
MRCYRKPSLAQIQRANALYTPPLTLNRRPFSRSNETTVNIENEKARTVSRTAGPQLGCPSPARKEEQWTKS